jgi:hypothetical protein
MILKLFKNSCESWGSHGNVDSSSGLLDYDTLKTEAVWSPETLVFYIITRCHNPEDRDFTSTLAYFDVIPTQQNQCIFSFFPSTKILLTVAQVPWWVHRRMMSLFLSDDITA